MKYNDSIALDKILKQVIARDTILSTCIALSEVTGTGPTDWQVPQVHPTLEISVVHLRTFTQDVRLCFHVPGKTL